MGAGYGHSEQDTITKDIQDLINSLDIMDDAVNERAASSIREGAEIVASEQRRLICGRSKKLPELIKVGKSRVSKKGTYTVAVGYDTEAIKEGFEGLIMEFGRPGKRSGGVDKNGKRIGKVTPTPHIFRAVDNKGDEATSYVINAVSEVIKW